MVEQTEEAHGQQVRLGAVGPGEQLLEEAFELLRVDAVLLQVRQAGVVALRWVAAAAPVAAGQVLRLDSQEAREENSLARLEFTPSPTGTGCSGAVTPEASPSVLSSDL